MDLNDLISHAYTVADRVGGRIDDEYRSLAHECIVNALAKFDESRGVPIKQYVGMCVRRAVRSLKRKEGYRRCEELVDMPQRRSLNMNALLIFVTRPDLVLARWFERLSYEELMARYAVSRATINRWLRDTLIECRRFVEEHPCAIS